ncbi:MAG: MBL fold metallo-hydrolase [Clostridia bacterium]|nr:MBL fold metallo-hydrolase [Clostridia bacterium]
MRLTFIGTSHGVPEPHRRCSSYLLEVNGAYYIIDMGTQTVEDLRRLGVSIDDVRLVICTHPHGDHTNGLISFVDLVNWYFKSAAPTVLVPDEAMIPPMKAWIEVTGSGSLREGIALGTVREGVTYEDENIQITAVRNQHCKNAFSFFVEAEGKRVLFTGDLRHPTVDFPAPAFDLACDLILCELAHFSADDCIPVFDKTKAKKILHTHISPRWHESLARQMAAKHPYAYGAVQDGMELIL